MKNTLIQIYNELQAVNVSGRDNVVHMANAMVNLEMTITNMPEEKKEEVEDEVSDSE